MSAGALKALVIGMGVLIMIAFAVAVWGIVGSSTRDGNGVIAKDLRDLSLGLPDGCDIRSAQSAGDRLTIVTDGPAGLRDECMRVFVIDTATGEIQAGIRP